MLLPTLAILAGSALAVPLNSSSSTGNSSSNSTMGEPKQALYFLDNNPSGASMVSMHLSQNGSLSNPKRFSTQGYGAIATFFTTGEDFPLDSTLSQGAVIVRENMLFNINSGSHTLSLFLIDPDSPWDLTLASTANTLGEFPVSVDYSPILKKACVLNGGAIPGVACFNVTDSMNLVADGPLRPIPKSISNEPTPEDGPPGTAAQIAFNPDQTAVFATIKGDSFITPNKLGSMLVWPVENGKPRDGGPIVNQIEGIPMDYAFTWTSNDKMLLVDPSYGASLLHVSSAPNFTVTETFHNHIGRNNFSCWSAWEPKLQSLYVIDAQHNEIFVLDDTSGQWVDSIWFNQPGLDNYPGGQNVYGLIDVTIFNEKMYAAPVTNGIMIFDLASKKQTDYFDLTEFGTRQFYQGMAAWPCTNPYCGAAGVQQKPTIL